MKTRRWLIAALGCTCIIASALLVLGQGVNAIPRYEMAMIKWDGPDKVQLITPEKSEMVRVFKTGVELPRDINEEAFCLTWAANKLAMEGWEPVGLNSTRILLRRQVIR